MTPALGDNCFSCHSGGGRMDDHGYKLGLKKGELCNTSGTAKLISPLGQNT